MNLMRMWLGLTVGVWFVVTAIAAPAPSPESQGPISDALRLRAKMASTAPPISVRVTAVDDNTLQVERVYNCLYAHPQQIVIEKDGKEVEITQYVMRSFPRVFTSRVVLSKTKFFTITKDGKLEAIDVKKAVGLLKKQTLVLTGGTNEVDARHLELVKPGTLYLNLPPPEPEPIPPTTFGLPK